MEKGILHLHVTIVVLFTLFFAYKVFLLFTNTTKLDAFRAKTKIVDMILGLLIIATGGGLLFIVPEIQTYLIVKIIITLAIIPLGIVSMKKGNKGLAILTLAILIYNFGVGKTHSLSLTKTKIEIIQNDSVTTDTLSNAASEILNQNTANVNVQGEQIFAQVCTACHGVDGKLGVGGAKDLSASTLSHEEAMVMISKGKGLMQAYEGSLSETEIEAVATYIQTLRK